MIDSYSAYISDVIHDTKNYELDAIFYLTRHCDLGCRGCYMRSSPNVPQDLMPYGDLRFYLDELSKIPSFTHSVVFSGGEIFTAPINYVAACSNMVLDRGWGLQLKTNGAWVADDQKSGAVVNMLRQLKPKRGLIADDSQIKNFLRLYPRWLLRLCGRWLMMRKLPTASMLSMAVSVDDKLHPARSADWFVKIVDLITNDKKLSDKVCLKSFTVMDSLDLLEKQVINNPQMKIKDFEQFPGRMAAKYTVNGVNVESYVGDFVDVGNVPMEKKLTEIVVPPLGGSRGRVVYCFYPDGTVGFDCNYLESVGRVPFKTDKGEYKPFAQIQHDIHQKLVSDYARVIQK